MADPFAPTPGSRRVAASATSRFESARAAFREKEALPCPDPCDAIRPRRARPPSRHCEPSEAQSRNPAAYPRVNSRILRLRSGRRSEIRAQPSVAQNLCAQTAASLEELFGARCDRAIHPVARTAFLGSGETQALQFEVLPDQLGKIDIARDNVAPHQARRTVLQLERAAELVQDFARKKCDLPFVIVSIIEEPVAPDAVTSHAFDLRHLNHRVLVRLAVVVAEKVVPR